MDIVKATFNLPTGEIESLRRLALERLTSVTAVLRQAIATELFLDREVKSGSKLLVEKPNGQIREIVRVGPGGQGAQSRIAPTVPRNDVVVAPATVDAEAVVGSVGYAERV